MKTNRKQLHHCNARLSACTVHIENLNSALKWPRTQDSPLAGVKKSTAVKTTGAEEPRYEALWLAAVKPRKEATTSDSYM